MADLHCDMTRECDAPVTHLDDKGYAYCAAHGVQRACWRPCRRLTTSELAQLRDGKPLTHY